MRLHRGHGYQVKKKKKKANKYISRSVLLVKIFEKTAAGQLKDQLQILKQIGTKIFDHIKCKQNIENKRLAHDPSEINPIF